MSMYDGGKIDGAEVESGQATGSRPAPREEPFSGTASLHRAVNLLPLLTFGAP
jgi:hypothetical protein